MGSKNPNPDEEKSDGAVEKWKISRRFCLQYGGLIAGSAGLLSSTSTTAAGASYETITIPAGEVRNIVVDGNQVLENKLYDVTADGAGVTFRLRDTATIRNVGIKGSNQSDRFAFRVGGGSTNVTIDRVYTECFDTDLRDPGGILASKNSGGTVNIKGATIKGWANNGLYASKTDADIYVDDCFFVNNRTANFRGGGNYHGNNRDAIFRNCVCVLNDLSDVGLYPLGGDRTVGYIARWGHIEVRNCDMYLDPDGPDIDGTISDNSYCMRTDGNTGTPEIHVWDSEVNPRDRINGDVVYEQNVGSSPATVAPDYAPTSAEDAASGYTSGTSDPSVAVSTGSASAGATSATLNGSLDDLGGASSADVGFEYRQAGTSSWTATAAQTRSSTGSFSQDVSGLSSGTDYEFRAVADASDGDTDTGTTSTFTTDTTDTSVAVSTDSASGVGTDTATLNGTLDGLGGAASADVSFEYGESGGSLSNTTATQTLSSTGSFDATVSGLASGTDYEFRAAADASDGDTDTGGSTTFTTGSGSGYPNALKIDGSNIGHKVYYEITVSGDIVKGDRANSNDTISGSTADGQVNGGIDTYDFSGEVTDVQVSEDVPIYVNGSLLDLGQSADSAPSVDRYEVTEADSPNPHVNITAEWDVSDADGDLATGLVEVVDSGGSVVDSSETSISGSVYYGVDYFEIKQVDGQTFDVQLTVTDANGNQATATRTVTE